MTLSGKGGLRNGDGESRTKFGRPAAEVWGPILTVHSVAVNPSGGERHAVASCPRNRPQGFEGFHATVFLVLDAFQVLKADNVSVLSVFYNDVSQNLNAAR